MLVKEITARAWVCWSKNYRKVKYKEKEII